MSSGAEDHYSRALRGEPCRIISPDGPPRPLPVANWLRDADEDDQVLLDLCRGATLDVGCGPGRMTAGLAARGASVLGIDVVREAVDETIRRGGTALRRDVHDRLPGEGRWNTVLLADGNIGIGGDPLGLLGRVRALLAPTGRAVVETSAPVAPSFSTTLRLDCGDGLSRPFRWAFLGAGALAGIAESAGMLAREPLQFGARWCTVLEVR